MASRCFGESPSGECKVLYVSGCNKEKCAFYKSVEQAKQDYTKAEARCRKLGIPSNNDYTFWKKAKDMAEAKMSEAMLP